MKKEIRCWITNVKQRRIRIRIRAARKPFERCENPCGGIYKTQYNLWLLSVVQCQPQAAMESPRHVVAAIGPYQYPRQHLRS